MNPEGAVSQVTRRGFVGGAVVWVAGCTDAGSESGSGSGVSGGSSEANTTAIEVPSATDTPIDTPYEDSEPTAVLGNVPEAFADLPEAQSEYPFLVSGEEAADAFSEHLLVEANGSQGYVELNDPGTRVATNVMGRFESNDNTTLYPVEGVVAGLYEDGTVVGVMGEEFLNNSAEYSVSIITEENWGTNNYPELVESLPSTGSDFLVDAEWGYGVVFDASAFFEWENMKMGTAGIAAGDRNSMVSYRPRARRLSHAAGIDKASLRDYV